MPTHQRKLRVLICNATGDQDAARKLHQKLKAEERIEPWLVEEKLLPGYKWLEEIPKIVDSVDGTIVLLSSNSVSKGGDIIGDLRFFLDALLNNTGKKFLIPVLLDESPIPSSLANYQFIDFSQSNSLAEEFLNNALKLRAKALLSGDSTTDAPPPPKKKDK